MKSVISWNVNGIRAVQKKGFIEWLRKEDPDFLCIQETKAQPDQLDSRLLRPGGYYTYWASAEKKGYSGVATYSKEKALSVRDLGLDAFDNEGRVQILEFSDFTLLNAYFPNSQEAGRRIDYKVAFCDAMLEKCNHLVSEGKKLVLCGDYNIAHTEIDLKNPKENEKSPGYLPEERAWMSKFLEAGYVDTFRMFHSEGEHYTWWSYRTRARERNAGWRIDYHCVNEGFREKVHSSEILSDVMGSDHCPVRIHLSV
ncbi:MAG: exodeoxyribonuclease III [Waddliaceae bacterium]|nr:exodeoxyribonuclease III [Waddliaceae bacterium]